MEFVLLIIALLLATGAHWLVRRDTTAALAFGLGLFVYALVPVLAALVNGR